MEQGASKPKAAAVLPAPPPPWPDPPESVVCYPVIQCKGSVFLLLSLSSSPLSFSSSPLSLSPSLPTSPFSATSPSPLKKKKQQNFLSCHNDRLQEVAKIVQTIWCTLYSAYPYSSIFHNNSSLSKPGHRPRYNVCVEFHVVKPFIFECSLFHVSLFHFQDFLKKH